MVLAWTTDYRCGASDDGGPERAIATVASWAGTRPSDPLRQLTLTAAGGELRRNLLLGVGFCPSFQATRRTEKARADA
jgi:hypothetical protein